MIMMSMADVLVYNSKRSGVAGAKLIQFVKWSRHDLGKENQSVSLNFVGDKKMRQLNLLHRGKNKTTDVLSFPASGGEVFNHASELGDIFISIAQIKRQARRFEVTYKEELARMILHGLLHLAGYDHDTERKAKKMFSLQESLLQKYCL